MAKLTREYFGDRNRVGASRKAEARAINEALSEEDDPQARQRELELRKYSDAREKLKELLNLK